MTDLIERLREQAKEDRNYDMEDYAEFLELAADALEAKDAEIERLTDELINVEELAKDRYCKMQAQIERLQSDNKWLGELRDQLCSDKALLTALRKEDGEDMQRLSDQLDYLSDENAKLQIVVDAAKRNGYATDELIKALAALKEVTASVDETGTPTEFVDTDYPLEEADDD